MNRITFITTLCLGMLLPSSGWSAPSRIKELADVVEILMKSIVEEGGMLTDGPPPKSATERNLQKAIEKHYKR